MKAWITNPRVTSLLDTLYADAEDNDPAVHDAAREGGATYQNEVDYYRAVRKAYMPVGREFGNLLYALVRSSKAKAVVEFGTSFGISAIYLAAAVRDNGEGKAETAPIFLPNHIGGYMPALPGAPGWNRTGNPDAIAVALTKGYVVAAPGARGRTSQDQDGKYIGKAPACIVDLKAAARYLRHNDKRIPGDAEKIISNGTSAGGAISALLGATGNHPDYEPYLQALGAAHARDDIFAASCSCPITNLNQSDNAYEWMFDGIIEYYSSVVLDGGKRLASATRMPDGVSTPGQNWCGKIARPTEV